MRHLPIFILCFSTALPAFADHQPEDVSYSFIELNAGRQHVNSGGDADVMRIKAELSLTDAAYVFAGYESFTEAEEMDVEFDDTYVRFGVGAHFPLGGRVDGVVGAGFQSLRSEYANRVADEADGTVSFVGLRGLDRQTQYGVYYEYGEMDDDDYTLVKANLAFYLDRNIAITADYSHDFDNINAGAVGLRIGF